MMNTNDKELLRRCIQLATEAKARGDEPFGSLLADKEGKVLAERQNREHSMSDVTAHPEIELARWASVHLSPDERTEITMYTSGEHCPMCASAQALAGIGRLVFAASGTQLRALHKDNPPRFTQSAKSVISGFACEVEIEGPSEELAEEVLALFRTEDAPVKD